MEKHIPFEKLSKKEQRKLNNKKRNMWTMNPITRKEPKNSYKQKKYEEQSKSMN